MKLQGDIRATPLRPITGGQYIVWPPKPKPGPLDPLGPQAEVDFLSGFRVPREGSGSRGKHMGSAARTWAPLDGVRKTNQGPAGLSRGHGTDQGPAILIRAPNVESGPRGTDQGPAELIRAPRDGSGPRKTVQGPSGQSRVPGDG